MALFTNQKNVVDGIVIKTIYPDPLNTNIYAVFLVFYLIYVLKSDLDSIRVNISWYGDQ